MTQHIETELSWTHLGEISPHSTSTTPALRTLLDCRERVVVVVVVVGITNQRSAERRCRNSHSYFISISYALHPTPHH